MDQVTVRLQLLEKVTRFLFVFLAVLPLAGGFIRPYPFLARLAQEKRLKTLDTHWIQPVVLPDKIT